MGTQAPRRPFQLHGSRPRASSVLRPCAGCGSLRNECGYDGFFSPDGLDSCCLGADKMPLLSWKSTIQEKYARAEMLTTRPLTEAGRAELTTYARQEHAHGRALTATSAGAVLGGAIASLAVAVGL